MARADAERNRDKILAAARAAFADPAADPSMAEIARRAGVGQGTLYRNFASRREQLEALYLDHVDAIVAAAETLDLASWLRRFFAYFTSKRHVAEELLAHSSDSPVFGAGRPRVVAAGQRLLEAAQASGAVRGDLSLEQILDLVIAVARIDGDPDHVEPIHDAVLEGLRSGPDGRSR
jgi:AcrR family transcriptional regulator